MNWEEWIIRAGCVIAGFWLGMVIIALFSAGADRDKCEQCTESVPPPPSA